MNTIFGIAKAKRELDLMLSEEEISTEDYEYMQLTVKRELVSKSVGIIHVYKAFENGMDALDSEIARLKELRVATAARLASFQGMVTEGMRALDVKKVDTGLGILSLTESVSTTILEPLDLPKEFMVEKVVPEKRTMAPDKTAIKKAILAGSYIPGAELSYNKRIKIK